MGRWIAKRWHVCLVLLCALQASVASAAAGSGEEDRPKPVYGRLENRQSTLVRRVVGEESRFVLSRSRARFDLTIPAAAQLTVGVAAGDFLWKQGVDKVDFTVVFRTDEKRNVLLEGSLDHEPENRWHDVVIPLQPLAGLTGSLELDVEFDQGRLPMGQYVFWTNPRIDPSPRRPGPSIVLISIDTLRPDHLGCYGYGRETSPHLDRLARESVLFKQAVASSNWTLPSHASMFTGLHPSRHGATRFDMSTRLRAELRTLPEILWDDGYRTIGITGGGFVSHTLGFDQGFDRYGAHSELAENVTDSFDDKVERAIRFLEDADHDRFFLFLHTYAVHAPYQPGAPYDRMFDPAYEGRFASAFDPEVRYGLGVHDFDKRTIQHLVALYDGGIRLMDESLGELLDYLRRSPPAGGVCVVVTSDHGEEFNEHGHILHRQPKLYEELIRVPLIFWCPDRFDGGRVVEQPVSLVDIMPTLLDIAGVPIPSAIDGRTLTPLLKGEPMTPVAALSEADRSLIGKEGTVRSVRTSRYKLILPPDPDTPLLFDLDRDVGETRDVSAREAEQVARLKEALSVPPRNEAVDGSHGPVTPDRATLERLRALGYLP